ncbi:MAG: MMPL family transporter, partial [Gammaproteobacteria bacterium]
LRLIAAIALAGAGGVFAVQLGLAPAGSLWENDLAALSPVPASSIALDRELRAALGAPDVRHTLVLRAPSVNAVLEISEAITPALERLREREAIGGFETPSRYLPSVRTQLARRAALPDAGTLNERLRLARAGLPFKPGAFTSFIRDVVASRDLEPLELDDLAGTALGLRLAPMLIGHDEDAGNRGQGVVALVQLTGVKDPDRVATAIAAWQQSHQDDDAVRYMDIKSASDRVVTSYRDDALRLLGLALPVLALALWLGTRSVRRLAVCVMAIALAVVVDLGLLAATGTRLSVFHLIAVVLVAGIGLDYGLFFSRPDDDAAMRARTLHAVCVCALSTLMVFGLLATSSLPVLHAIGVTVALGVALAFASTLLLARDAGLAPRPERAR